LANPTALPADVVELVRASLRGEAFVPAAGISAEW
jgi:hypothetical protein